MKFSNLPTPVALIWIDKLRRDLDLYQHVGLADGALFTKQKNKRWDVSFPGAAGDMKALNFFRNERKGHLC